MSYVANRYFGEAEMWIRKIRIYKDMLLHAFVDEMSRREGLTIKRWDCHSKGQAYFCLDLLSEWPGRGIWFHPSGRCTAAFFFL